MGVNMVGNCIVDDAVCREASNQEILRRYYQGLCDCKRGVGSKDTLFKLELIMKQAGLSVENRAVVNAALKREEETGHPAMAIELDDGTIVTGKTTDLLGAASAALLNTIKVLGGIDHDLHLVSPDAIAPIQRLKTDYLGSRNPRLHTDEILIALSASAASDSNAELAMVQIPKLQGLEAHSSVLLSSVDEQVFKRLGIHLTSEAKYETENRVYHKR